MGRGITGAILWRGGGIVRGEGERPLFAALCGSRGEGVVKAGVTEGLDRGVRMREQESAAL